MANPHNTIGVQVHYVAATKPFKGDYAPDVQLTVIKADALKAFELTEDQTKVYKMFYHKTELSNLNATIGSIVGDKHEAVIDLEEVLVQGK